MVSKAKYGGNLDSYEIELLMNEDEVVEVIRDLRAIAGKHSPHCLGVRAMTIISRQLEKLNAGED